MHYIVYENMRLALAVSYDFDDIFIDSDIYRINYDDDEFGDDLFENVKHFKAFNNRENKYAVCQIINPEYLSIPENQKLRQLTIIKEAFAFKKLNCPFVVKFLGLNLYNTEISYDDDKYEDEEEIPCLTLFYEYPENLTLLDVIQNKIELTPVQRQIIIIGVAYGLWYLHINNVVHGCLCPKAIWLD